MKIKSYRVGGNLEMIVFQLFLDWFGWSFACWFCRGFCRWFLKGHGKNLLIIKSMLVILKFVSKSPM
jgi:hypothetical protein